MTDDEFPRPTTSLEALGKLRTLNAGGVTTAGNASGINDGAAALVVGNRDVGDKVGTKPLARILASAVVGVPPRIMGIGPVPAAKKALARAGITLADIDVIEINEAFAAQVLACLKGARRFRSTMRASIQTGARLQSVIHWVPRVRDSRSPPHGN